MEFEKTEIEDYWVILDRWKEISDEIEFYKIDLTSTQEDLILSRENE
jgi:hypothetical protein